MTSEKIEELLKSLCFDGILRLKQIDHSRLYDSGHKIVRMCFGSYDWPITSGNILPPQRRFAGDKSLPRGRYYTIASDSSGNDSGTLYYELLAYGSHETEKSGRQGYFEFFDLTVPEQRQFALKLLSPEIKKKLDPFLEYPILLVGLLPAHNIPHPFAAKHNNKAETFWAVTPLVIQNREVRNVIDLRIPAIADAFCKIVTRSCNSPLKKPLDSFSDLLPTLLNQELGGGTGACPVIGNILRNAGIWGLIYPSARSDTYVKIHNGSVVDSGGWIYLEYGENVLSSTLVVDFDPWHTKIIKAWEGPNLKANRFFENVKIDYVSDGPNKGSWSVHGLEVCQDAFFYLSSVTSMLAALGEDVLEDIQPLLAFFIEECETCDQLAILATNMIHAMHGIKSGQDLLAKHANRFKELGVKSYAYLIEDFLSLCPCEEP